MPVATARNVKASKARRIGTSRRGCGRNSLGMVVLAERRGAEQRRHHALSIPVPTNRTGLQDRQMSEVTYSSMVILLSCRILASPRRRSDLTLLNLLQRISHRLLERPVADLLIVG